MTYKYRIPLKIGAIWIVGDVPENGISLHYIL
jgi:hypothetical protein